MERIRKERDYRRVYRRGRRFVGRSVVVHVYGNRRRPARFGISVSKKVGKAVKRNLVKRRLREVCRRVAERVEEGFDVVVSARPGAAEARFDELLSQVEGLLRRAGILKDGGQ